MDQIKVKVIGNGQMPVKKTKGAAAYDCYARIDNYRRKLILKAGARGVKVPLGFAVELPQGYRMEIYMRSGTALKTGLRISNGVGIIDSDYRGEVNILLDRLETKERGVDFDTIEDGDRIAQAIIVKEPEYEMIQADELSETERGAGGFGSTGVNDTVESEAEAAK